jgi:hypothetical protein
MMLGEYIERVQRNSLTLAAGDGVHGYGLAGAHSRPHVDFVVFKYFFRLSSGFDNMCSLSNMIG